MIWNGAEICLSWMPDSVHRELYAALICASNEMSGAHRQLFIDVGLIHLLVVSGAHLHFLERWLVFLPNWGRLLALGSYCWLTGFGAPVVRAWMRRFLGIVGRRTGLSLLQLEFATILVLLLLRPSWAQSRSFLMCWMCALALAVPRPFPNWPNLSLSLTCYLMLLPFVPSAPVTVLVNVLITPYIGGALLPLCILAALLPALLMPITDLMWSVLLQLLRHFPVAPPAPWVASGNWMICIPLSLHLALLMLEVPWRRARAFR